ncbi:MAG: cell wall hydrolase/autolysin [Firmicutes bacterium]|nr:cell wall hydrolase/autolysin [Bacillota bacterium]
MRVFYLAKRHFLIFLLPTLLVFLALFLVKALYGLDAASTLTGKVIIVDAGHGGIDSGANRPSVAEKDINLAISLELKEELNRYGAKVVLSRQSDIELSPDCDNEQVRGRYHRDLMARAEMAEESDADLFISIHANAVSNAKRHGAEVFYFAKSEAGKQLAESIQTELCKITQPVV